MARWKNSHIAGIDEAGRGPLAGPLSMAVVVIKAGEKLPLHGLKDSKKLSYKAREEWFKKIKTWKKDGNLSYKHVFISAQKLDSLGMSWALKESVKICLEGFGKKHAEMRVFLDGGLRAPDRFKQKTIIKGDEKIPVIALASIVAKVFRDRKMIAFSKKYPKYCFNVHKGYGTTLHRKLIRKHGVCILHRKTYIHF